MSGGLFSYPDKARRLGRLVLPKTSFYAHGGASKSLRVRFVEEVDQITWPYTLRPDTLNLPAKPGVPLINVLEITLRTDDLDERILACIDRSIPSPLFFELRRSDSIRVVAAHKRPSEVDHAKWVTGDYFSSPWLATDTMRSPLPVALDLASLYEQMLRTLLPGKARPGESIQLQTDRASRMAVLARQIRQLEARLKAERQFNRKVELNAELRGLQNELAALQN